MSVISDIVGGLGNGIDTASGSKLGNNVITPATGQQAQDQYNNAQSGLAQQQAFINALQAQNGIQNQSDVYNQLQMQANGQGPNPAQAMLAQQTGNNVANQAALMAGQRGANANVGLIARQAAQQGANTQQQAVGQGATLQAQQSANAINSMGNLATSQVGQQANALNGYNSAAQNEQGQILGAIANQNRNSVAINQGKQQAAGQMMSNVTGAAGAALGLAHGGAIPMAAGGVTAAPTVSMVNPFAAAGGPQSFVGKQFAGDISAQSPQQSPESAAAQAKSAQSFGAGLKKLFSPGSSAAMPGMGQGADALQMPEMGSQFAGAAPTLGVAAIAKGGRVPVVLSPGEKVLNPKEVQKVASAKDKAEVIKKEGKTVPGKAKVSGDSLKNDTYKTSLESGGIVIPRSISQGKNAPAEAAKFVAAVLARKGSK